MAFSDFIKAMRKPTPSNEYVASRPATGSLSATGSLALNDDDGLAAKVINTPPHTEDSEGLPEPAEDQPEDTQPTDTEDQAEDTEDQPEDVEDEQPKTVRDLLLEAFAGEPELPTNVTQDDVDWARRVVVSGDRAMETPLTDRTVRRDARTKPADTFTPAQPEPTEGQRAALEYLHATGEHGTVAVPDKGLTELLEAAVSPNDEVVDMVMDALDKGGATGTFFDQ